MSIKLTKISESNVTTPTSGQIVIFADSENSGKVTMKDSNGNVYDLTDSGSSGFTKVNIAQLNSLINNKELIPGNWYEISGVDQELYGGTTIYLKAITSNGLDNNGIGRFYNPKYDNNVQGYNIWSDSILVEMTNIVGEFDLAGGTDIVGAGSDSGVVKSHGIIQYDGGTWDSINSISGSNSGATADIEVISVPSYSTGDIVHWGGKSWRNLNGNVGSAVDIYNLDPNEWEVIPYNDTDYNMVLDRIKYDINNDLIVYREEANTNIVSYSKESYSKLIDNMGLPQYGLSLNSPIKSFMWGNIYDSVKDKGIGNNFIYSGLQENINFRGIKQTNIKIENSAQFNILFEDSHQHNIELTKNSVQANLIFSFNSKQEELLLSNSRQENLIMENLCNQSHLEFKWFNADWNSIQYDSKNMYNVTFNGRLGAYVTMNDISTYPDIGESDLANEIHIVKDSVNNQNVVLLTKFLPNGTISSQNIGSF